jgi:hypothetical protein
VGGDRSATDICMLAAAIIDGRESVLAARALGRGVVVCNVDGEAALRAPDTRDSGRAAVPAATAGYGDVGRGEMDRASDAAVGSTYRLVREGVLRS